MNSGDSVHFEKYNLDEADVELQVGLASSINNPEIHKRNFLLFMPGETKKGQLIQVGIPFHSSAKNAAPRGSEPTIEGGY